MDLLAAGSESLHWVLKEYWGYDSFLPHQREAMECVLAGRDSLVVLPTGGGKSLCYQAPALAMPGVAIVVSPLISLMKDQVDALRACGAPAAFINSSLTSQQRHEVTTPAIPHIQGILCLHDDKPSFRKRLRVTNAPML